MTIVSERPPSEPQSDARRRSMRNPRRDTYTGLIVLALGVCAFYFSITHSLPFFGGGGRLVTAYFSEPNQLEAGTTPVRVDGINVGSVESVSEVNGGRYGRVVLRITDGSLRLHEDASAEVEFRTLLGANFVVDLNPGSPSAPLLGNGSIPASRTGVQSELDDVLHVFNGNTPAATRADLKQLSGALSGRQLGTLIDTLEPTLTPTTKAFRALSGVDPGDLEGLVHSAAATTQTLADDEADVRSLLSGGQATLGVIADERGALGETLDDAPGALNATVAVAHSIETTIAPLNRLIGALGPGARELAPSTEATRPAVEQLRTLLLEAQPLLASLRPAVARLSAASTPGRALFSDLAPTIKRLNSQLIPWLESDDSDLKRPVYQLIAPTFAGLGSAAAEYDGSAHILHFPIQPEANSLTFVPCTVFVAAPTPSELIQCANLNQVLSLLFNGSVTSSAKNGKSSR
jgi:phospholipid/cholesterol/gamma-HCH transport system substrate-binding protein